MRAIYVIPVIVAVLVTALSSVFIVDERKKALVLQFGQVRQIKEDAGLGFKMPFIQEVVYYEDRILGLQTAPIEVTLLSDRRLVVDAFARWRIVNLAAFRGAVAAGGEDRAQVLLNNILQQAIPEVLGKTTQDRVLSQDRTGLMNEIRDIARREAQALGVEVIDVRLTRTDLPEQNLAATFARMRAEREREAADEIARGGEAAQRVRAAADRTVVEETSFARRQAEVIRGEADAERNSILAEAYGQNPEFFAFIRSLNAYEVSLRGQNSSIVMQPDSQFFEYLRAPGEVGPIPEPAAAPAEGAAAPEPAEPAAPAEGQ
ncbi:Modulator of FtsH protease HflC [Pseudogemmobacter humi]|uniref:Protein HflC n=2 Tax=Pseudogemmobacter humi TaxID=2483812 RepID=A0A3P5XRS9_9RHOB|nr:Modulator of FtsH protease HflC [Pseudogemmobacter humi]